MRIPFQRLALALLLACAGLSQAPSQARADAVLPPGQPLTEGLLASLVEPYLDPPEADARVELRFTSPALPLPNPAQGEGRLRILDLRHDPATGRFDGHLHARLAGGEEAVLQVSGSAVRMVEVPVPAATIRAGSPIGSADIAYEWFAAERLPAGALTDPAAFAGTEAKRTLRPGRPVRARDLQAALLVRKGETLVLAYRTATLDLQVYAKALEDGAEGSLIRVANTDTDRVVRARVVGPRQAEAGLMPLKESF
ncbi:MAG: flagellar basal body P-ring formation protein FlgA [Geminicoccaceae bacterium]|nr:flagellar basal body P-ring formation protein FlgA [Geminicoccaceae bacterium]